MKYYVMVSGWFEAKSEDDAINAAEHALASKIPDWELEDSSAEPEEENDEGGGM